MKNFYQEELMLVVFIGAFTLTSLNAQTLITRKRDNTYSYAPAYSFYNYIFRVCCIFLPILQTYI
jgi:hypothetical protein